MSQLQPVEELCSSIRGIFEHVLAVEKIAGTAGTCLYGSILLQQALDRFGNCEAVVRGGDGAGDGGAQDKAGAWHGHYWVEGRTKDGKPFLADITADQFGWPPVVVLPLAEGAEDTSLEMTRLVVAQWSLSLLEMLGAKWGAWERSDCAMKPPAPLS